MSKLFDALQKIEQQQGREVETLFVADSKRSSGRVYMTMLLLAIVLLLSGGVVLYYLDSYTDFFLVRRPAPAQVAMAKTEKKKPAPSPVSMENNLSKTKDILLPRQSVNDRVLSPADNLMSIPSLKSAPPVKTREVARSTDRENKTKEQDSSEERRRTVQKLLYQAEKRRKEGDMTAAVKLYARAWQTEKSPGTANNLAAGLYVLRRYGQAYDILQEALILSPHDRDLQYNLQITKEKMATSMGNDRGD